MSKDKIDLSSVFDGVKPVPEVKISRITAMMHIDEHMEDEELPNRVLFTVPPKHNKGEEKVVRYARINSLPTEMRNLINLFSSYQTHFSNDLGVGVEYREDTRLDSILKNLDDMRNKVLRLKKNTVENKCENCSDGIIQHTSFPSHDGSDELTVHVYGCNRCENGWSAEEK